MRRHVEEVSLLRFAEDASPTGHIEPIKAHLAECPRCRETVQEYRRLRAALVSDAAVPSEALLARITASRRAGVAVILPVDPTHRKGPNAVRIVVWGGLMAAVAIGVVALEYQQSRSGERPFSLIPEAVANRGRNPALPMFPTVTGLTPAGVRPIRLEYERRPNVDGVPILSVVVIERLGKDSAGWRVIEGGSSRADTVILDAETLAPVRRMSYETSGDFIGVQRSFFTDSGIRLVMDPAMGFASPAWKARLAAASDTFVALPRTLGRTLMVKNMANKVALFMALQLHQGWQGSLAVMIPTPTSKGKQRQPTVDFENYEVIGSEKVRTPSGTADCWIAARPQEGNHGRALIRKSDGVLVRLDTKSGEGSLVLINEQPAQGAAAESGAP